jgi:hypothetical protein
MKAQPIRTPEYDEHFDYSAHAYHSDHRRSRKSYMPAPASPARLLAHYGRVLVLLGFVLPFAAIRSAATDVRGQSMVIRLLTPLASYSPPGTRFDAKVIGPVLREGFDFLPSGSIVTGQVNKSASVRFGVLRERAKLELEFDGCRLPDGTAIECTVSLQGVDNAREKVSENRIAGVLAASHLYSWLNGLWYRPGALLLSRSAYGLTGAGGEIYMHLAATPLGAAAVITSELLLYRMPDPEIEFPAGTDLLVRVQVPHDFAPSSEQLVPLSPELSEWVAEQPEDVYLPDKRLAGDLIHLVFVGSREQVEGAFQAAGWSTVQPLTRHSFTKMYSAFLSMKADPTAPIAPLLYRGSKAAFSFQKTLNTVAKRHHIRIWPASFPGPEAQLWLAAGTHDTTITLDERHMSLTHRIDKWVDRERSTVVNDLSSAGCVAGIGIVPRPQAIRSPDSGMPSVTDGNAALLFLDDCTAPKPASSELSEPQHRRVTLALRRFFLGDRQYLCRDNPYYWVYRATSSLWPRKPRNENGIE